MANGILKGKRGIIFGALDEKSIAWKVAEEAHRESAIFVLSNAPIALRMGTIQKLADACGTKVIGADATSVEDLDKLMQESMQTLGGKLDFILHSIGMSPNVRKDKPYTDLNYEFYHKTLDISAMSLHKTIQSAYKLDAMNDWGSIVALTYIAAQRVFPDYGDMADAKAMLESIARSWGYHYGVKNKVRVNTISQSPTNTTAGSGVKGFNDFVSFAHNMSPLGNADAKACANYCISLFSDYSRYVTMQNLFHDGGFSSVGVTNAVLK